MLQNAGPGKWQIFTVQNVTPARDMSVWRAKVHFATSGELASTLLQADYNGPIQWRPKHRQFDGLLYPFCTTSRHYNTGRVDTFVQYLLTWGVKYYYYRVRDRSGDGGLFSIDFFVCMYFVLFFVSLLARLRENGWTDLHETFREGVEWPWDDLITFLINSDKPRDAAMRNTGTGFVVLSHHSLLLIYDDHSMLWRVFIAVVIRVRSSAVNSQRMVVLLRLTRTHRPAYGHRRRLGRNIRLSGRSQGQRYGHHVRGSGYQPAGPVCE